MKNPILVTKNYIGESISELRKATWPTKNQAVKLTVIVLGFTMVFTVALIALDYILNTGFTQLLNITN